MKEVWQSYSEDEFQRRKTTVNQAPTDNPTTSFRKATSSAPDIPDWYVVKRKKPPIWLLLIVTAVVVPLIFFRVYLVMHKSVDMQLKLTSLILNKKCPQVFNDVVRWDNVVALPNKTMQYNYTFLKEDREQIGDTAQVKSLMKPMLIEMLRKNEEMKYMSDNKVIQVLNFNDRSGQYAFQISLTADEYSAEGSN